MKTKMLGLLMALAAVAAALSAFGVKTVPSAPPVKVESQSDATAPVVSVVAVVPADFVETVLITGSVVARNEVMISPEVEGLRIEQISAEEGDKVAKGQLLASLSTESLEAQLAQNKANIARADAAIAVARSGIVQAEAAVKEASNAFDRAQPLKKSGYLSGAAFDQRESAAATSQSKLIAARDGLTSAQADKAAFEAQGRDLAWKHAKTEVRAPVDGVVSRRTARVGAVASALNDPLFRIIESGELELDAEVAESDLGKIKPDQRATITITGGTKVSGSVRLISSEVDRATRIGKVRVFLGVDPALKLGAFGRGVIETAKSRGLSAPTSAVVYTQGSDGAPTAKVQLVREGRVIERVVKTGLKTQTSIEIRDGLENGAIIVARSGSFLRDGDTVRPVLAGAAVLSNPDTLGGAK